MPDNADDLRRTCRDPASKADQAVAFFTLIHHHDLRWADYLEGLAYEPALAEVAAFMLHMRLDLPKEHQPIGDAAFWEAVLRERGIDPASRVGPFKARRRRRTGTSPLWEARLWFLIDSAAFALPG